MMRTYAFAAALLILFCALLPFSNGEDSPLFIVETETLTERSYEMTAWENPFVYDGELWLVYQELTPENEKLLMYRTYDGEWSAPQLLSDSGEFIEAVEDSGTLTIFWNVTQQGEDESTLEKSTCFTTFTTEWSPPSCVESEPFLKDQFVVKIEGNTWLVWSRRGFWEYQVFEGDSWSEKQVLTTTEDYEEILKVLPRGEELWIFYKKGTSDIYYRIFDHGLVSEPLPLITEGFPYLQDAIVVGTRVMVFLVVQEESTDQKTLAYMMYDGEWSSLEALATAEEGFLSGGALARMTDDTVFVFWNGAESSEAEPLKVDLYYRWYDGNWSGTYKLTDTPDIWEATFTGTEYSDKLVIIWRDKESTMVYASYASRGEGEAAETGELEQVTPKTEPEKPEIPSLWYLRIKEYFYLIPVGGLLCALLVLWHFKKRISPEEGIKKVEIGKRRKKKAQRKSR